MLVKIQGKSKQEGNVIFHLQVNDILQRIDLQVFLVGVIRLVYRIVEGQQMLPLRKQRPKQRVLVLSVHIVHKISFLLCRQEIR